MTGGGLRVEYVEARRVLLDALDALREQLDAVVLAGAQAVYLRTEGRLAGYQPFTTDADLVLDPARLVPTPSLGDAMMAAGFVLTPEPGVWEARFQRPGMEEEVVVPVDLIVPAHLAPKAGRRAARLPDEHGKTTARKSLGLEGTVVDYDAMVLSAFEPSDPRQITVNVAGVAALFVAKLHKLGDRLATPERLQPKDAGDVYRLFESTAPDEMATTLGTLLSDERSATTTEEALGHARRLFLTPASPGVALAASALRGLMPEATVGAVVINYTRSVLALLGR
jgi:hypothetical protein